MGGMLATMPTRVRKGVVDEFHDPRLYSNLRGAASFETAKERVHAHRLLDRDPDYSVAGAMREGFTRGGHSKEGSLASAGVEQESVPAQPQEEKTSSWFGLLAAPAGHLAVNAGGVAGHHGSNIAEVLAHRGFQAGLTGSKMNPVSKFVTKSMVGPESLTAYEAAHALGSKLAPLHTDAQHQALQAIMSGAQHPALGHAAILGPVRTAIGHELAGTSPALQSHGMAAGGYSKAVDYLSRTQDTPFDTVGRRVVHGAVAAAPLAAATALDPVGIAAHVGTNQARNAIGQSGYGKKIMGKLFDKGLQGEGYSPGVEKAFDYAVSPGLLDPMRVGRALHDSGAAPAVQAVRGFHRENPGLLSSAAQQVSSAARQLMSPPELKTAAARVKKEKRRPWNVANHRTGKRPMSVDTMLKKEKDGTLQSKFAEAARAMAYDPVQHYVGLVAHDYRHPESPTSEEAGVLPKLTVEQQAKAHELMRSWGPMPARLAEGREKASSFNGPILPFADESDKGAAPAGKRKMDNIPSAEGIAANDVKRQDSKDFVATVQAPGNALNEVGAANQPQERTASANPAYLTIMKIGGAGYEDVIFEKQAKTPYLLSEAAEHHTDLGGLGLMAGSSIDKLRSQIQHPENTEQGSVVGGTAGRSGMDLAGLAAMSAPTIAQLAHGGHTRADQFRHIANIAGLGALAIPTLDNVQAGIRARRAGVSPEEKMLLGHKAHAGLELAGYGALAAPVIHGGITPSSAATLAGYGTLAAPVVEDLVHHGDEKDRVFQGAGRSATELAGLGLLAGGVLSHKSH